MKYLTIIFSICFILVCHGESNTSLNELRALFEKSPKKKIVKYQYKKAKDQYKLAVRYAQGKGIAQNSKEAVKWFRKAAEQGHALAQYNLGDCYYQGRGVAQDSKEAVKWFRKAAEQDYVLAQYRLAVYYFRGQGGLKIQKKPLNGSGKQRRKVIYSLNIIWETAIIRGKE